MEVGDALSDISSTVSTPRSLGMGPPPLPASPATTGGSGGGPLPTPTKVQVPPGGSSVKKVRESSVKKSVSGGHLRGAGEGLPRVALGSASKSFSDEDLKDLQVWLDHIPFTRSKKHLHRDFSDGVLMAELVANFFPKMIELHNYIAANSVNLKKNNWDLLNRKVFPKLGIKLQDAAIESICQAKPGYIEQVLYQIRKLIDKRRAEDEETKVRELARIANGDCGDGISSAPLTQATCLVHILPNDVPDFIIYRGQKYFPEESMQEKIKAVEELSEKNKELTEKVRRLETLATLKERYLEDLTRQLHQLRINQGDRECVCKWEGDKSQLPD